MTDRTASENNLRCPECDSTDLKATPVPGGADRVCSNCEAQFDVFEDGPDCVIPGDRAKRKAMTGTDVDYGGDGLGMQGYRND